MSEIFYNCRYDSGAQGEQDAAGVNKEAGQDTGMPRKAWVVFGGEADRPWLRFLKPGFRHCYLIVCDGVSWMTVDPMLHHMDVRVHHHLPLDFDLPGWLRNRGMRVVGTTIDHTKTVPAPLRLLTCVETVKRFLGIHARFVFTPWQLYRHLSFYNPSTGETIHG